MPKVVYKLQFETCGAADIGKTRSLLSKKNYQHKTDNKSAVKQHSTDNTGHFFVY